MSTTDLQDTTQTLYKFLLADRQSPTGTGTWTVGRWRSVRGDLVPCRHGLHATTANNLIPFMSETLWRVEIDAEHLWHTDDAMGRKLVARRLRIVERVEAWNDRTARLWACDVAERVLKHFEDRYPEDTRPREAIEVARRFARGDATREELSAADRAADWAAYSAAYSAYSAAYSADRAAYSADSAAYSADSAASAARAADWAAYRAAYSAEREWQGRHLCAVLNLPWPPPTTNAEAQL